MSDNVLVPDKSSLFHYLKTQSSVDKIIGHLEIGCLSESKQRSVFVLTELQLSAIKFRATFDRKKFDSMRDIKFKYNIQRIHVFLEMKLILNLLQSRRCSTIICILHVTTNPIVAH